MAELRSLSSFRSPRQNCKASPSYEGAARSFLSLPDFINCDTACAVMFADSCKLCRRGFRLLRPSRFFDHRFHLELRWTPWQASRRRPRLRQQGDEGAGAGRCGRLGRRRLKCSLGASRRGQLVRTPSHAEVLARFRLSIPLPSSSHRIVASSSPIATPRAFLAAVLVAENLGFRKISGAEKETLREKCICSASERELTWAARTKRARATAALAAVRSRRTARRNGRISTCYTSAFWDIADRAVVCGAAGVSGVPSSRSLGAVPFSTQSVKSLVHLTRRELRRFAFGWMYIAGPCIPEQRYAVKRLYCGSPHLVSGLGCSSKSSLAEG